MPRKYPHLKPGFNPKFGPKMKYGIFQHLLEFDDGRNAIGWVAFRLDSGKVIKFYFHYYTITKLVRLFVARKSPHSGIWRKFEVKYTAAEAEVWRLLHREGVVSELLIKKVFARMS